MNKIAIIEDDKLLSIKYCNVLKSAGYEVTPYLTRDKAKNGVVNNNYDAWVLDIKLGQEQNAGIGLIGVAKDNNLKMPILVVSGLEPSLYRPITFELGVWDYVQKPVEDETLVYKIRQLIAASNSNKHTDSTAISDLQITEKTGVIVWKGYTISLPLTAWNILLSLIKTPNKDITYDELKRHVKTGATKENIRQHIRGLRSRFEQFDPEFKHIEAVTGIGYKWMQ